MPEFLPDSPTVRRVLKGELWRKLIAERGLKIE